MTSGARTRAIAASSLVLLMAATIVSSTTVAAPVAAASAAQGCTRSVGPAFYAPGTGRTVALSFDDGPTRFTPQVLRILRNNNVRASFYMTGRHAAANPRLVKQVADEGHLIAGHTFDHDYPSQVRGGWTRSYIADQMRRTNRVLSVATEKPICFFRPPGGHQTSGMYAAARARRTAVVLWSVSSEDWAQPRRTRAAAIRHIVKSATAGGSQAHPSVLMHDGKGSHEPESQVSSNRSNTVAALPKIIEYYRSRGYRFVDAAGGSGLPPEATDMHVTASPRKVPSGKRSVLTGTVTATTGPVANQEITWFSRISGQRWKRGGALRTGPAGGFRLAVRPKIETEYRFLLPSTARHRRATDEVTIKTSEEAPVSARSRAGRSPRAG